METRANLTFDKIRYDQENTAHLVVSLTAPVCAAAKRPPLCVVPVIDVSPSMEEGDGSKLRYAKKSLIKLIEHLSPQDYCGLIKFSATAETVQRPVLCTPEAKEALKRKVMDLRTSGATNIADALLEGFKVANEMDLSLETITRVILFTDGEANRGPAVKTPDILALIKPNIGLASVSAFGYGERANSELLLGMAQQGNGNYAFVQNPDDALSAFGKELGGLLSTYATNFTVEVEPLAGHSVSKVVTDVDAEEEDMGQVLLKFPELLSEETRHFVLEVKLKQQNNAFPRDVNVFNVKIGYDILDESLKREHKTIEIKAKAQFVKQGEEQTKPDADLDQIVGLAQMVRAQLDAEVFARTGDYMRATSVLDAFSTDVKTRGMVGLGDVATNLSRSVSSQHAYVAGASYRSSVTRGATRGYGGTYSAAASADLESLGVRLSNTSQGAVADSFTVDDGAQIGDVGPVRDVSIVGPTQVGGSAQANWYVDPNQRTWTTGGVSWPQPQQPQTWDNTLIGPGGHNPIITPGGLVPQPAPEPAPDAAEKPKKKRKIKQKSDRW